MKKVFAVYNYCIDDQTLLAIFKLEGDALECKKYLEDLKAYPEYEGFYIQEEWEYDSFDDYIADVRSK